MTWNFNKNIGYCNAERYKCPPNEQYKYFWISIRNIIIYLETKFRPNRRIFLFWRSSWIQNGRHSKPKWSQYGAACLIPCKYPFPLKSFHFWIFNDFFNFYIGGHFENFKNKEHNFEWWSIFVSSFKRIRCLEWI